MKKIYQRAMAVALAGTTLLGAGIWHKHHRISPAPSKQVTKNAEALPTGVSEATLADIRSSLEKQEYHISYDERKKKLQSPNRRNNIRAYYEPGKLTVQTRVDTTGEGFKMELVNEGVFADGKLLYTPEAHAKAEHHENKVQIGHNAFTEEFINNEDGVRQNFIIENAPEGTRQLQIKMTAKGLKVEQRSGNELRFYSEARSGDTRNELVYSDLQCWDANKKPLSANLAYVDSRIQISVDVAGATYPVTIDPIIANGTPQNANKVLQVDQSYMWLGFSVASAGDVNGDGYSDVVIGAPKYDLGEENEGGAFVYKGGPFVLTATAVTFQSNQKDAQMGYSVASAGDFNGDGFSDVLVGVPYYDKTAIDEGRANLYLGSNTFFDDPITAYSLNSGQAGALMGLTVATAGDIDGDGFSDILVGSPLFGANKAGAVRYYKGNASGAPQDVATLAINLPNAQFGYSIAPAGDVDADGFSDVIIGARWYTNGQGQDGEGAAFIYRGGGNGLQSNPTILEGNQYNAAMGNKVSSAGDVNGDGYSDVLISAYLYDLNIANQKDHGIVNLYLGSSTGITSQQQPSRTFYGKDNDHMGSSIACAGDVNGDGYSDILLGAEYYDNGQFNEGGVFVYYGSQGSVGIVGEPVATMESNQADGWFGTAVASAGDVNGDGFSDIALGAYQYDKGSNNEGVVMIYFGSPNQINTIPDQILEGDQIEAQFGFSVACAGDVNADGFADLIVGARYYDKGQNNEGAAFIYQGSRDGLIPAVSVLESNQGDAWLGSAVAPAGDVNGDGFSDLIIGAKAFSDVENGEGAAFLYKGSGTGIKTNEVTILQENQANGEMGSSVSTAGDVNSDGFGDVIVGAPKYGKVLGGAAFVYYGSYSGINVLNRTTVESDKPGSLFGISVRSSGDVNADGYGDIIIGAQDYNFGAAFVFNGSPNGIIVSIPWYCTSDINTNYGELMGASAAGAGDVNADGFSDVIIGSLFYKWKGASLLFYGNAKFGLTNAARLYNTDLSTPINHTQFPQTNFGAGLFAKSFTGRNKGKLVWETRPTGQGFSKGSNNRITNSTQSTASQNTYSNLGTTGFELKNVIDKQGPATKVRVRVKYDPVLALTGQSYGPWRYLPAYLMGTGTAPVPEEKGGNLSEIIEKRAIRLEEGKASEVATIYPNPVSSRLNIDLKDKDQVQSLRILTATGSVMYQSNELRSFVDVSKLPEGAYFLIITKTDGSHTTRQILIRR